VTFFSKLGVPYIGSVMNIVVLTAALSSLNSGLYSPGVSCAPCRWAVLRRSSCRR
jgi:L-asparagine transporter-like permease